MTTQQGLRQESARSIHGLGPGRTYNGDMMSLFQSETSIPSGTTFNGAFLAWINARLGASFDNLPDAQTAFANDLGLISWNDVGAFNASFSPVSINFPSSSPPRWAFGSSLGADSTSATMTWWEKPESTSDGSDFVFGNSNSNLGLKVSSTRSGGTSFPLPQFYDDISNNISADLASSASIPLVVGEWNFVAVSIDFSTPAFSLCLVNSAGVITQTTFDQIGSPTSISFGSMTSMAIGSFQEGLAVSAYFGELAEIFIASGTGLVDFSIASNRRKFVSSDVAGARPVSLGADGSTPFGSAALAYFTGTTPAGWNNVAGTGAFTVVGTPSAGTGPSIPSAASASAFSSGFSSGFN